MDLKPCPFCGAVPDLCVIPEASESPRGYFCKCPCCLAETGASSDRAEALAVWNRRTAQAEESAVYPAEPCFTCNGEGRVHDPDAHPGMFRPADMTRECPTCEGTGKAEADHG